MDFRFIKWEIAGAKGCTAFPLGAGGGGILIFSPELTSLQEIKDTKIKKSSSAKYQKDMNCSID